MAKPRTIDPCGVYGLEDMAEALGVSVKWLRAQTFERKLPACKLGRAWAYSGQAMLAFLADKCAKNLPA